MWKPKFSWVAPAKALTSHAPINPNIILKTRLYFENLFVSENILPFLHSLRRCWFQLIFAVYYNDLCIVAKFRIRQIKKMVPETLVLLVLFQIIIAKADETFLISLEFPKQTDCHRLISTTKNSSLLSPYKKEREYFYIKGRYLEFGLFIGSTHSERRFIV